MAPTAMEKLESERSAVSDTLSRIDQKVKAHPVTPLTVAMVSIMMDEVAEAKADLKSVHTRIRTAMPDDIEPHKKAYFDLADEADSLLNALHGIKANFPTSTPKSSTSQHSGMRLPKLDLKSFDGNLLEWISFRDMFSSSIHTNASLSKVQKLTYLKSLLQGEAAKQIQSMILSDGNYDTAWQQLQDRYQNDREILFAILRKFFDQKVCPSSPSDIRSLVDTSKECLRSMEILNLKSDKSSDAMMLFVITTKLDSTTRELWEQSLKGTTIPPLFDLFEFLEQRARALAAGGGGGGGSKPQHHNSHQKRVHAHHGQSPGKCAVCSESFHSLFKCSKFNALTISEKYEAAKKHRLCFNCLQEGHATNKCTSAGRCKSCNMKHHSLLHKSTDTSGIPPSVSSAPPSALSAPPPSVLGLHSRDDLKINQTMLATAIIRLVGGGGQQHLCRALLDGGSTASFISNSCLTRVGLCKTGNSTKVLGLATASVGTARGITSFVFSPHFSSTESFSVNALVLPKVTGRLPVYECDPSGWNHLNGITLADPEFHKPAPIDILLGSDVFWHLLNGGKRDGPAGTPLGIHSVLGLLVAGTLSTTATQVSANVAECQLDELLQNFWDLESIPSQKLYTKEESQCESYFDAHHTRDDTGRFTVSLPLKEPRPALGESRSIAEHRLKQLERRLSRNDKVRTEYTDFMREYLDMGHMSLVPVSEVSKPLYPTYFIPHHFVVKEDSTTTKLRVVFDASAKTTSGQSLNDTMLVGPQLQDNLVDIVMRFRLHVIAFTADVAKMYRTIRVTKTDADLQRILWRESPVDQIQEYRLDTVTYGTASAPYLAVKVLQQLAKDESSSLPLGSAAALQDFYVDDVMTGGPNLETGIKTALELDELTRRGGMLLRKFYSNSPELLKQLRPEQIETKTHVDINIDQFVKALGIRWNTNTDSFEFQYLVPDGPTTPCTKRSILSEMSKLFDPLCWLSPIIVRAKILMQDLWKGQAGWDDPQPPEIQQFWSKFKTDLKQINFICIPRCIIPCTGPIFYLAGFSDASEKAYSAVVYLCVFGECAPVISLVISKTRVAPAKTISIPRLELCGAVLLVQLLDTVQSALKLPINNINAWTDSTVVLDWIQSSPSKWKTFVANRVTIIQNSLPGPSWKHVPGVENPADVASRGTSPSELSKFSLWWKGPDWLKSQKSFGSVDSTNKQNTINQNSLIEERKAVVITNIGTTYDLSLLDKYSDLTRLLRISAWIMRFGSRSKLSCRGSLSPVEINSALYRWIKLIQHQEFSKEINLLKNNQSLPAKNSLLSLNPFVDENGILRVGGRLRNAAIPQDQKTPALLPRHSKLTELIIFSTRKTHCHAGPNLLLAILQQRFWILRGRDAVRFLVRKCVTCTRQAAVTQQQFMADLPVHRVTPTSPFQRCGVDYAGPFLTKPNVTRSKITIKSYLAIFVCFSTRAFHLEIVSSLSTEAFLAAFRRFISRRGLPSDVHSDCGTNFVGANREMKEMMKLVKSDDHNNKIATSLANDGIQWHFNPPGAPHFGGLWEAGVKSVKYHLNRIVGPTRLTFEELTTTITQVEACLNSRPLTPFSSDPSDLTALTSGHFLIGKPLLALPEPDLNPLPHNKLSRWQLVQNLQQQFWRRWSSEFLARLQQRPKWLQHRKDLVIGDLVLIKHENLPPQTWKMGRVIKLHPGPDGNVRVTTLRTADGEVQRTIAKLSSTGDSKQ